MPHTASHSPRTIALSRGRTGHPSADRETLFAYGTLLFPEVLRILIDRVPDSAQATVEGWRAAALPGCVYPGLVPARKSTKGLLLHGITTTEWQTIDSFEDNLYELRELPLRHDRRGWAYVYSADAEVSPNDWDPQWFATRHLTNYLSRCIAWRRQYEDENRLLAGE
jgi:gamma-glutamylcyclotransferase (GGCT)/AIG2-like uncharacterized protein YtfP